MTKTKKLSVSSETDRLDYRTDTELKKILYQGYLLGPLRLYGTT